MSKVFKSEQFQWALYQAGMSLLIAAIVAFTPFFAGQVAAAFAFSVFLGAAAPVLMRLREGVADAQRADNGAVLSRDVTSVPDSEPKRI